MEQQDSILGAFGGLNTDDSLISPPGGQNPFEKGDYRYARNVRIGASFEDNTGGVENFASTLAITNYYTWDGVAWVSGTAPTGTNVAIGKIEDHDEGAVYWAVYNSGGDHQILKFVKSEHRIYELLKWSGLNFLSTHIISMSRVSTYIVLTCRTEGGDGNYNPPRLINTTTIFSLKFTLAANFSEYHISFAKWPGLAPVYVFGYEQIYTGGNLMLNGLFQFSYRYVYSGGMKSTWAPPGPFISIENGTLGVAAVTRFRIYAPGFIYDYENQSSFANDSIKFYEAVEFIEFAFRQSTKDTWKLFRRLPTGDGSKNIIFDNNGPAAIIDQKEIGQYFDSVPFRSGVTEVFDNRVMFADNDDDLLVEDFDVEDVEMYSSVTSIWTGQQTAGQTALYTALSSPQKDKLFNKIGLYQYNFKERGIYKLGIIFQHWSGRTGLVTSPDNWTYLIPPSGLTFDKFHSLGFKIPASVDPPIWAVAYQIVRSNCLNIEYFVEGNANDFIMLGISPSATTTQTPQEAQNIINEYYNSIQRDGALPLGQRMSTYYRNETTVAILDYAARIYIDLRNWYLETAETPLYSNPGANLYYSFQFGDRVRFKVTGGSPSTHDVEIVDSDGKGVFINKPPGLTNLPRRANGDNNAFFDVEIYRIKPFQTDGQGAKAIEFYEMGEWYPVTDPTTPSRDFEKRDFTWGGPSAVTATAHSSDGEDYSYQNRWPITLGDVHWFNKTFFSTKVGSSPAFRTADYMSMNANKDDAAGYWEHNTGRPFIAYRYKPVNIQKTGQIRFGLKFLEDSVFTAINTFLDSNAFIYPGEYGKIRAMKNTSNAQVEAVGNILLVLGEIEAWSVYVNRSTLEDLSGRTQVSISDQVLGSYNTLLGSFGTLNPESISAKNGRVVWWNAKKGAWVRYSRDGNTEISGYKMSNWFKDISVLIIDEYSTATPPKVISVWDEYYEEWLTRIDHSSLPATFKGYSSYKCVSFAERNADKRWKSAWDYAPDLFAGMDNDVYSIIGNTIQIHEQGADFGSIYGVAKPSQIELVSNPLPRAIKDWRTISLLATDKWSFERIMGDWKSNSATIQETRIKLESLDLREGIYFSEIKRDKNSPNAASEQAGVISGNPMKSHSLRLLLQLDPAVDYLSVLNWLSVSYSLSSKVPKN